jgi:hypothetical protein
MNIMELGALGEFLGFIGVIATLAYLAFQIRQNTQGLRLTARQTLTQQNTDFTKMLLLQPDIGDLYSKTVLTNIELMQNPMNLSIEELTKFARLTYIGLTNLEDQYHAWKSGVLSEEEWSAPAALIANVYAASKATQDYWETVGRPLQLHGPSFSVYFDDNVRQARKND